MSTPADIFEAVLLLLSILVGPVIPVSMQTALETRESSNVTYIVLPLSGLFSGIRTFNAGLTIVWCTEQCQG
jgi:hypothetical protein